MIDSRDIRIPADTIIQVVTQYITAVGRITYLGETVLELTPIAANEEDKQVVDTLPVIKIIPLSEIKLIFILKDTKEING
jgi:hypothetical protein